MEILALLLLGFIAMLAIVPPIIRGRLNSSPLATTQSFQRSMEEMANSLEPYSREEHKIMRKSRSSRMAASRMPATGGSMPPPQGSYPRRRNPAAIRRARILVILTSMALIWGTATLISGKYWCLIIFAILAFLSVVYWALSLLVPRLSSRRSVNRDAQEPVIPPKRQAM